MWIAGIGVDQLGAELGSWFGADAGLLDAVFPRLQYFEGKLGLMKV